MGKIYKNQTSLRIKLTTGVDITDAKTLQIKYIKPEGDTGTLTATENTAATGIIHYDIKTTDTWFDESGDWEFYAYVVFSDDRFARGESVLVKVSD